MRVLLLIIQNTAMLDKRLSTWPSVVTASTEEPCDSRTCFDDRHDDAKDVLLLLQTRGAFVTLLRSPSLEAGHIPPWNCLAAVSKISGSPTVVDWQPVEQSFHEHCVLHEIQIMKALLHVGRHSS